ncbi:PGDYG domain-containing protein [Cupriavidus sp. YAF13]|uniref:PGDYG domain-containing protein n=1 Tax=Cupriavidus sp. YAF13 TaxID=3233075 RepID=UPI003F933E35
MPTLAHIDLRTDPAAALYQKHEVVQVAFAKEPGELISLEGPNRYQPGDAIITGSTGDRWVVSRERFDPKYEPLQAGTHGQDGAYQNIPGVVLAKRMDEAFSIARSAGGDVLQGAAGDWLMQYAPNDYGVVQQARFAQVYRPASGNA